MVVERTLNFRDKIRPDKNAIKARKIMANILKPLLNGWYQPLHEIDHQGRIKEGCTRTSKKQRNTEDKGFPESLGQFPNPRIRIPTA